MKPAVIIEAIVMKEIQGTMGTRAREPNDQPDLGDREYLPK